LTPGRVGSVTCVTGIAGVVVALVLVARLAGGGFDPSRFVVAGSEFTDGSKTPTSIVVLDGPGYDGQFVLRLALDPWTSVRTEHGITLDRPAYRQQRVALPAAAWLASLGGRAPIVLWILPLLGALAMVGTAAAGARLAVARGLPPVWGLAPALSAGLLMSLGRGLNETFAVFFLVLGLLCATRERWVACSVVFTLGALSRETILIPAGLVCVVAVARHRAWVMVTPFAVVAAWVSFIRSTWGTWPPADAPPNFGVPGVGLFRSASANLSAMIDEAPGLETHLHWWACLVVMLAFGVSVAPHAWRLVRVEHLIARAVAFAWIGWTALALCMSTTVWGDAWAWVRVLAEWFTLGWVVLLFADHRPSRALIASLGLLSLATTAFLTYGP